MRVAGRLLLLLLLLLLEREQGRVRVVGLELEPVAATVGAVAVRSSSGEKTTVVSKQVRGLLAFETLPTPQKAPVIEHIGRLRVQSPIIPLPGVPRLPWDFHKTVIK